MERLIAMRDLVQEDVRDRGLRADPVSNLISAYPDDFRLACQSIAETKDPSIAVVTGFFISDAQPPAGETDGPLGALFLARALSPLGIRVTLVTDGFCYQALKAGVEACALKNVAMVRLPSFEDSSRLAPESYWQTFSESAGRVTHLIAIERPGPSHTLESVLGQPGATDDTREEFIREVLSRHHDRCQTMRGRDVTHLMSPAHYLFEMAPRQNPKVVTLGVGDGGNEIGMGKIRWEIIRRNVAGGAQIACRVPVDHLIVCGISNWGAYALGAGIRLLLGHAPAEDLFDPNRERDLLRIMVEGGPLVDGVLAVPSITVDGLSFERYAEPLERLRELAGLTHNDGEY
jgi:hypothetical protein